MNYVSIGKALSSFLRDLGLEKNLMEKRLLHNWREIIGDEIASVTKPVKIEEGVLYLRVSDPVWRTELQFILKEIRAKIDREIGENIVSSIKLC
jgi:predicted nucleic acid-binding Zn ribbon protein